MKRSQNGTRMIDGVEYLLNGTLSGYGEEDTKAKARIEQKRLSAKHIKVRMIRRTSCEYAIYTHG